MRYNIKYDLKNELSKQIEYGTSKHQLKITTQNKRNELRQELKACGVDTKNIVRECDNINDYKDKIFSTSTFNTYMKSVNRFANYVIENAGTRRISIEESKRFIQHYIDKLKNEGYSASYQKKELAAICKATHAYMRDYTHDKVLYAEQVQRKIDKDVIHQKWNDKRCSDILDLNRCLGIRRSDLKNLKTENIHIYDNRVEVYCFGSKGGKDNLNVIFDTEKRDIIESYYNSANEANREYLVTREQLNNDADLHAMRALNAKEEYTRVLEEITNNKENRQYYIKLIESAFTAKNKKCNIDFEKDYICRGENAKILRENGIETRYDRVALMYVSVFCLNHWREDVSVQHYLCKK